MTTARKELVDVSVTRWYHTISKCVRGGWLLKVDGDGGLDRKRWIENRLKLLTANFSVAVGGFSIMDNHLHVLCRLDPEHAKWADEEVVRRWIAVYPPRNLKIYDEKILGPWVKQQAQDAKQVALYRERLADLGWFMKALKEPLSRFANRHDGCQGAFWQARYKSIAVLDTEALLATCAYIDLNPVAAGIVKEPENSDYTSIKTRVDHVGRKGKTELLKAARQGSVAASRAAGNLEDDLWLVPIEDRRSHTNAAPASAREGMVETFSLGSYLLLVDFTGRLCRNGKAQMSKGIKEVFERIGIRGDRWVDQIKKMLSSRDLRGTFFASDQDTIKALATKRGCRMVNLCPQVVASVTD